MNLFYHVNKILGIVLALVVAAFAVHRGLGSLAESRREMGRQAQRGFERRLQESADSMPPGLNGEYPADGPLADHYRRHTNIPVAP